MKALFLNLLVFSVRIASKVDLDDFDSGSKILNAGFRSSVPNYQYGARNFNDHSNVNNVEITCVGVHCNTTKTDGTVSTDVLVQVKTNVDTSKLTNKTKEVVPDIPVIVGTKTNTDLINNIPSSPDPVYSNYGDGDLNYPIVSVLNREWTPSAVNNFERYPNAQSYGGYSYTGNGRTAGFFDNQNHSPSPLPNSRRPNVPIHNPVEFRKTYDNTWAPVKWNRDSSSVHNLRLGGSIPRWTPCLCNNNQQPEDLPSLQYNHPPGISGKLASLV